MIFEAVRRLFGLNSRPPEELAPRSGEIVPYRPFDEVFPSHPFSNSQPLDISDMDTDINRIHDIMEQQMRSMMESFGFMFGGPSFGVGPSFGQGAGEDDKDGHSPQRGMFPFSFGIPGLPGSSWSGKFDGIPHHGMEVPARPGSDGNLEPRDEVLKPQFRRVSPGLKEDEDLDGLVKNRGAGVILDMLKPGYNNEGSSDSSSKPFSWMWNGSSEPQLSSSSTVTIYRNINGHSTYEQIIRHPDGRVDRTVIKGDGNSNQPGPLQPIE